MVLGSCHDAGIGYAGAKIIASQNMFPLITYHSILKSKYDSYMHMKKANEYIEENFSQFLVNVWNVHNLQWSETLLRWQKHLPQIIRLTFYTPIVLC